MHCSEKVAIGLFGSLYFIAVCVSSLVLSPLSDRPSIGRKKVVLGCCILHIVCVIVQLSINNLQVAYVLIFLMGLAMPGRCIVGFIWGSEFLQARHVKFFTSFIFGLDGLCLCNASLFFKYISTEWKLY